MALSKEEYMEVILLCGGRSQQEFAGVAGHTEHVL
jgi:hypothetical protein